MPGLRYLADVVTLELDADKCTGCGMCAAVCPQGVFAVSDGKVEVVDRDACMECGACARNCAAEAISVRSGVGCAAGILIALLQRRGADDACCASAGECCDDSSACRDAANNAE